MHVDRHDVGEELTYDVIGVVPTRPARVRLKIDKFVGGGFAGQVYRVKLLDIDAPQGPLDGLEVGRDYAMKILLPLSRFSRLFRKAVYWVGFQGPFQLQVNPTAARAGALWQKFIRRAAGADSRFGDPRAVVDIHATFVDQPIGSCGELSEWVAGRVWRFEVDNHLDMLKRWIGGRHVDTRMLGSPEYRAKRRFMAEFVKLLHEIGAHELARQYEWGTCKSQPNVLKRLDCEGEPAAGLTAVDFRAGLALLPMVPMSPGDIPLIIKGLGRGSLVQFDRGDLDKLAGFVETHPDAFADMGEALEELKGAERIYRDSVPDITHNHLRLLFSRRLWSTMLDSAITGWGVRNIVDDPCAAGLRRSRLLTLVFMATGIVGPLAIAGAIAAVIIAWATGALSWPLIGALAGLAVGGPLVGRLVRSLWGRADHREHYGRMLTSPSYLRRASRGKIAEKLIAWHRAGRLSSAKIRKLGRRAWGFLWHLPLSLMPVFLHRMLTDRQYARKKLHYVFVRPVWLYFKAEAREHWLREMLSAGQKNGMLSREDADLIESQIKEPFIQKYLKSMAVHVCTLPITQVVAAAVAVWYVRHTPDLSWKQAWERAVAIMVAFQFIPISPGSLIRGLYVLYLVIRERNVKDYNIAVLLGFFKYIGYLAFPLQMAYRYPALARFMAAHWSAGAVHFVPVFGEHGAMLEHGVFNWFYNWPLTIRRRMRLRAQRRKMLEVRHWRLVAIAMTAVAILAATDWLCARIWGTLPHLREMWPMAILVPLLVGSAVTLTAGGAVLVRRLVYALVCGIGAGLGYAAVHVLAMMAFKGSANVSEAMEKFGLTAPWRIFAFSVFAVLGALITELYLPAPEE